MNILETAKKELGVTAKQGTANNPRVLEYFAKVGHSWVHDDQTAWCAAFVGFVLETCGIRSTRLLNARSYLKWGFDTTKPVQGDVVVFWRESISGGLGHVSFFHHEDENTVYCLGGNQSGEAVTLQAYPKTRVLGYRSAIKTNVPQAQPIKTMEPVTETVDVLLGDSTRTMQMKKPNFEVLPNTHYCMISEMKKKEDGTADMVYVNFTTDETGLVRISTLASFNMPIYPTMTEQEEHAKEYVDADVVIKFNL